MEVIMYDLNVLIFDINKTAEDEEQVKTLNNLLSLFGGKAEIKNTFDRNQLVLSWLPSPRSSLNLGVSCRVDIIRISRIPAVIKTDIG